MKILTVGEFKTHFSDVLNRIRQGEEIIIASNLSNRKLPIVLKMILPSRMRNF
jgi:hypothetical protein